MKSARKPAFRLPDHLRRAKSTASEDAAPSSRERPSTTRAPTPGKTAANKANSKAAASETAPPDRITGLLPVLLTAMIGTTRPEDSAGLLLHQDDVLGALAPYHRPKSRFEMLVVRKLVGEGYLKPRGARDKHGFSGTYEVTPKGRDLVRKHARAER